MNFFEYQQRARRQTWRLLLLFAVALISLILLLALAFAAIGFNLGLYNARFVSYETGQSIWQVAAIAFQWQYLGSIALAVLLVVSLAAWFRSSQLSAGGRVVAEQLGGQLLNINAQTVAEQRALNVVEEMAIASGVPVPPVYVIDEPGINAFAAGYKPVDAVIGITRGAIEHLSRDELQGVIAHEFSHILNGDMRLNIRLMGLIFGIMVIAITGRYLLRGGSYSRRDRGAALSIGLLLIGLGYLGVFFGNIIKAAVSRQREYLADASAVQFTRNHQGIGNALKKIGGLSAQSYFTHHDGSEISHMLFAEGGQLPFFRGWLATHPPLERRIKRIDPQWNGNFLSPELTIGSAETAQSSQVSSFSGAALSEAIDHSGEITDAGVANANQSLTQLRADFGELCRWLHEPYAVRAFVCWLLLDERESFRAIQWQQLRSKQSSEFVQQISEMNESLLALSPRQLLQLLDIALPVLKQLSTRQYREFKQLLMTLIMVDKVIELREWALFHLVDYYCQPRQRDQSRQVSLQQRKPALSLLLSALVSAVETSEQTAKARFEQISQKSLDMNLRWYSQTELSLPALSQALSQLQQLKPLAKPRFLKACIQAVEGEDELGRTELELVRCIAQALDCPLVL